MLLLRSAGLEAARTHPWGDIKEVGLQKRMMVMQTVQTVSFQGQPILMAVLLQLFSPVVTMIGQQLQHGN